jgi:hypothetical protein
MLVAQEVVVHGCLHVPQEDAAAALRVLVHSIVAVVAVVAVLEKVVDHPNFITSGTPATTPPSPAAVWPSTLQ